ARSPPPRSPHSGGPGLACPTTPRSALGPCSSSPAPTRWASRSRWSSRSRPSVPPAAACSSPTASRSRACAPSTPSCSTRPARSRAASPRSRRSPSPSRPGSTSRPSWASPRPPSPRARTRSPAPSAPALGVSARVDGHEIRVGGPRLLEETGAAEHEAAPAWREEGAIVLHVLRDGESIGALKLADAVREESREAIDALHDRDIQVVMITGDAQNVAEHVGAELGIDRIFAGVRPEDKADRVAELQEEGRRVAMVGDGVNDAPALARADVGLAIGAGTDVAIGSAGVVLASSDPRSVLSV